jgi:hypothetical protein
MAEPGEHRCKHVPKHVAQFFPLSFSYLRTKIGFQKTDSVGTNLYWHCPGPWLNRTKQTTKAVFGTAPIKQSTPILKWSKVLRICRCSLRLWSNDIVLHIGRKKKERRSYIQVWVGIKPGSSRFKIHQDYHSSTLVFEGYNPNKNNTKRENRDFF